MTVAEDNVTLFSVKAPASVPAQGGNGGGDGFGERLAALEERVRHLATSAEVEKVNTKVEKVSAEIASLRWFIGILVGLFGILVSGILFKLFFFS